MITVSRAATTCWQKEWLRGVSRRVAHGSGRPALVLVAGCRRISGAALRWLRAWAAPPDPRLFRVRSGRTVDRARGSCCSCEAGSAVARSIAKDSRVIDNLAIRDLGVIAYLGCRSSPPTDKQSERYA